MAKLKIVQYGDETLRKVCRPVDAITPRVCRLLDDMRETMRSANGCGLAGPQVGVLRRIAVVEVEEGKTIELINPRIVAFAGEQREEEGCLSIPGRWGVTVRPRFVTVRATDRNGKEFEVQGSDLLARALCHELDHLDGKVFLDRLAPEQPQEGKK